MTVEAGPRDRSPLARTTIRVLTGVKIVFAENADGGVDALSMTLGPQRIEARRRPITP